MTISSDVNTDSSELLGHACTNSLREWKAGCAKEQLYMHTQQRSVKGRVCGDKWSVKGRVCGDKRSVKGRVCGDKRSVKGKVCGDKRSVKGRVCGDKQSVKGRCVVTSGV